MHRTLVIIKSSRNINCMKTRKQLSCEEKHLQIEHSNLLVCSSIVYKRLSRLWTTGLIANLLSVTIA